MGDKNKQYSILSKIKSLRLIYLLQGKSLRLCAFQQTRFVHYQVNYSGRESRIDLKSFFNAEHRNIKKYQKPKN